MRCPKGDQIPTKIGSGGDRVWSVFNLNPDAMLRLRSKDNWSPTFETINWGNLIFLNFLGSNTFRFSLTLLDFIFQSRWSLHPDIETHWDQGAVEIPIPIFF